MAQTGFTPIQIYSSSTASAAPVAGSLTNSTLGSELAINITDGKLFYKDNANAIQVIAWRVTPTSAGGTGLTSYTAGDLLFYATGTTLNKLAIGASGRYLSSSGTAPQWSAPAALTETDDTNVTMTLGGNPSTALLSAVSMTLGWTGQLAVSRGGTGTGTAFTAGSAIFAGASGVYSQDNANYFWDNTNKRLGLGIATPVQRLDVRGTQTATIRIGSTSNGGSGDEFGNIEFWWADPDAAEVKAKIYTKNVGNVGPGGGGAADLLFATTPAFGSLTERMRVLSTGVVQPGADNTQNFGAASFRWATIFAGNGTINTSDRNEKTDVLEIDDAERRVAVRIKSLFKKFRMKDAVAVKGDAARIHFGVIAQDVMEAFQAEGLDANRYGVFCKDVWREYDGKPVQVNANNEYVEQYYEVDGKRLTLKDDEELPENAVFVEKIYSTQEQIRYGVRYEELLAFVVAAM